MSTSNKKQGGDRTQNKITLLVGYIKKFLKHPKVLKTLIFLAKLFEHIFGEEDFPENVQEEE